MNKKRLILFVGLFFCKSIFSAAAARHALEPGQRRFEMPPKEKFGVEDYGCASIAFCLINPNINQDTYVCGEGISSSGIRYTLQAVLDGHGNYGGSVSRWFANEIVQLSHQDVFNPSRFSEKIQDLNDYISKAEETRGGFYEKGGTTLTLLAVEKDTGKAVMHNIGDSQTVCWRYSEDGSCEKLVTEEHSCRNPEERKRIRGEESTEGTDEYATYKVETTNMKTGEPDTLEYVNCCGDGLAMTRSLGDGYMSFSRVISEPSSQEFMLKSGDRYLLCSDGLSDAVSDEDVRLYIEEQRGMGKSFKEIAVGLADKAYEVRKEYRYDDITVVVGEVPGEKKPSKRVTFDIPKGEGYLEETDFAKEEKEALRKARLQSLIDGIATDERLGAVQGCSGFKTFEV